MASFLDLKFANFDVEKSVTKVEDDCINTGGDNSIKRMSETCTASCREGYTGEEVQIQCGVFTGANKHVNRQGLFFRVGLEPEDENYYKTTPNCQPNLCDRWESEFYWDTSIPQADWAKNNAFDQGIWLPETEEEWAANAGNYVNYCKYLFFCAHKMTHVLIKICVFVMSTSTHF